jgi:hypothetical protein
MLTTFFPALAMTEVYDGVTAPKEKATFTDAFRHVASNSFTWLFLAVIVLPGRHGFSGLAAPGAFADGRACFPLRRPLSVCRRFVGSGGLFCAALPAQMERRPDHGRDDALNLTTTQTNGDPKCANLW